MSPAPRACPDAGPGGPDWRKQWRARIRSLSGLHRWLRARGMEAPEADPGFVSFPVQVTSYYAGLIRRADPTDPVYRQCAPGPEECAGDPAGKLGTDPFGETGEHCPLPGVIRRYRDRAVVVAARACAVHCRHCTRRHALASLAVARPGRVQRWLGGEPEVREVILSGGDPLTLSDAALEGFLRSIRGAPHVERIRIGTRMPVTLPQRITPELAALLRRFAPVWVATHFNHPVELTAEAARACACLADAGIPVVNQSVLLRGVNDRTAVLRDLFLGLVRLRVRPYYLLQCDPLSGIGHFRVPVARGLALMDRLRATVSGLALPVYAADIPGAPGKVPLSQTVLLGRSAGGGQRIRLPGGGEGVLWDGSAGGGETAADECR